MEIGGERTTCENCHILADSVGGLAASRGVARSMATFCHRGWIADGGGVGDRIEIERVGPLFGRRRSALGPTDAKSHRWGTLLSARRAKKRCGQATRPLFLWDVISVQIVR